MLVPDYYLAIHPGAINQELSGLEGVQRLYSLDLLALVSCDQVNYVADNKWSLGYLTIVGAYALKGMRAIRA